MFCAIVRLNLNRIEVEQILKIAFVDGEQECLDEMARICNDFSTHFCCPIETASFLSGSAFLHAFVPGEFSVVFMDIYMDGTDGVSAALAMRSLDSGCLLVFLTSSMEFMPEAFSCHAFEYIIKPFTPQRVFAVLTDALKVLPQQKYIELANGRKTIRIPLDKIISVITDAHYLNITLTDGQKLRPRMTMPQFIKKTYSDSRFLAINKGITVNAEHILAFENYCCIMENGAQFPVRVRDSGKIEQAAHDYNFEKIRSRQRHRKGD